MKVGFIGAGKVGFSLGTYMSDRGISLVGYYSRTLASSQAAAELTVTQAFTHLEDLVAASDCLFVTVPDDILSTLWKALKELPLEGKLVCHCSGLTSSSVFVGAEELGAATYSVHPIMAIPTKHSAVTLQGAYFTIEGSSTSMTEMCALIDQMGNPYEIMEADKKPLYHAACVSVSNLLNALAKIGEDLFAQCGLDTSFSQRAWRSLFLLQAQNIDAMGVVDSLTGPVERGDAQTVSTHLSHLHDSEREIYRLLSEKLLDIARIKNPERDYSCLEGEIQR